MYYIDRNSSLSNVLMKLFYPENGNDSCFVVEDHSFWFQARNVVICQILKVFTQSSQSFWDVGGGNGFVTRAIIDDPGLTVEATLIEPATTGCANAKKRGLDKIICASLSDVDGLSQNIGLFDVLEHIEDDHQFLRLTHTKLTPGGKLFITVPAYNWLWSDADESAYHFRRYNKKSLCKLLSENGFKVRQCRGFFLLLIVPILLMRVIPYRLGFRKLLTPERAHNPSFLSMVAKKVLI